VFYQLLFGLFALAGYLVVTGKLSGIRLRGKRKTLILLGILNAGAMVSYYMAVSFINVSISVLLLYTAPFYVLLLAPVFLKEKHNKKSLVALILSFAGVVMVIDPKNLVSVSGIEPAYLSGVLMGLFSGLFYACVTITSRYLRNEYSGLEQLFISTFVTLLLLLPFVKQAPVTTLVENLPVLLFLGVTITSLGSILYFTGLLYVKAQNASVLSLLEPVSAIFFAYLLLKDPVSIETLIGCVLILSSSFLASLEEESKTENEPVFKEKLPAVP